jgi:hypothetical protein
LVPLPISGRPISASVGALIALSAPCKGEALAASAAAYDPEAPFKACTNRSWNPAACALSV